MFSYKAIYEKIFNYQINKAKTIMLYAINAVSKCSDKLFRQNSLFPIATPLVNSGFCKYLNYTEL